MSADVIGVILGIMAAAATIFGGLASLLRGQLKKIDERFATAEARNDARFDRVDERFEKLETKIDELAAGLVDVKVAVARLEGPERRLQLLHT